MGETTRMQGKMRNCDETDARMLDVDAAADHRDRNKSLERKLPGWIYRSQKREVEGGSNYFKQSKATLNAMNVHLSQNVIGNNKDS